MLRLLNERRSKLGLHTVKLSTKLVQAARACLKKNLAKGTFNHCGYEVLFKAPYRMTPEAMIKGWFNSPPHKAALTHPSSRYAGPAIATNGHGTWMMAINIDY